MVLTYNVQGLVSGRLAAIHINRNIILDLCAFVPRKQHFVGELGHSFQNNRRAPLSYIVSKRNTSR